jgi:hypothetical protein
MVTITTRYVFIEFFYGLGTRLGILLLHLILAVTLRGRES